MDTMYPAKVNSPATALDGDIDDSQTTISLINADESILPNAPNLAVIGTGEDAETILYAGKSGNDLTSVTRGFQGVAKAWSDGTFIARMFTAYDYDTLRKNLTSFSVLYEYYNTGDNSINSIYGIYWLAQTFTPLINHKITSVKLKINREGLPGIATISIRATGEWGEPIGDDLCSGTTDADTLTEWPEGEWREITLGSGYDLSADVQYAIVVRAIDGSLYNELGWRCDITGEYTGGKQLVSDDSGDSWAVYSPASDMMFEVWDTDGQDAIAKKHTQLCEAADFTKLDGIEEGADVTADHAPQAHGNEVHDVNFEEEGIAAGLIGTHEADTSTHGVADLSILDSADVIMSILKKSRYTFWVTSGWTASVSGTGATSQEPFRLLVNTGTTASSKARLAARIANLVSSHQSNYLRPDFSKEMIWILTVARAGSDAEVTAYFHIMATLDNAAADTNSIGLKADNGALYGESYGASGVALTSKLCDLTMLNTYRVLIHHRPSIPQIDWYVDTNGTGFPSSPTQSQTTSGNIPQAQGAADPYIVISIGNGATGGVAAYWVISSIFTWINAS